MQFESVVPRLFGADFMLFDLIFMAIWIVLLVRGKHFRPLAIGLFGFVVYFIADYGFWYTLAGTRVFYELPSFLTPLTFLLYFSVTYGIIQFSYVALMFSDRQDLYFGDDRDKLLWSTVLLGGWILFGAISQLLPLNDAPIHIARIMTEQRIGQVVMVLAEYLFLVILAYLGKFELTWKKILYIAAVGIFVHFSMEFSLLILGIRNVDLFNLAFNSLLEFNTGAPILYLLVVGLKQYFGKETPAGELQSKE